MQVLRGDNVDKFLQREQNKEQAKAQIALSGLKEKTYPEVAAWIDEISDLASAKAKMEVMGKVILAIIKTRE